MHDPPAGLHVSSAFPPQSANTDAATIDARRRSLVERIGASCPQWEP